MNQIFYFLTLFEKLHYEHDEIFQVQGTNLHKLLLQQSKYTLLSTGQYNNNYLLATIY